MNLDDAPNVPFANKKWNIAFEARNAALREDANDAISAMGAAFAKLEELNAQDAVDRYVENSQRRTPRLEELLSRDRDRFDKLPWWKKIVWYLQLPW